MTLPGSLLSCCPCSLTPGMCFVAGFGGLQIDDPSVFPGQFGEPFPPNFMEVVRTIFKRLFRVYAHIYHSHFKQVCSLGEEAHLNTCFKHFIIFIRVSLRMHTLASSMCISVEECGSCCVSGDPMRLWQRV